MKGPLDSLRAQVGARRDYENPPLHLWHPPLSGDMPIRIDAQGAWYHEGGRIERESLVRLFASILRREEDGEYYLVTPGEKWRIQVELHPLLVTDISLLQAEGSHVLEATLNTGRRVQVSEKNPLFLDPVAGDIAAMKLPHGLTALCTRPAWYRLVELAVAGQGILTSGEFIFRLPTA